MHETSESHVFNASGVPNKKERGSFVHQFFKKICIFIDKFIME